jgi:hypothetical protein
MDNPNDQKGFAANEIVLPSIERIDHGGATARIQL